MKWQDSRLVNNGYPSIGTSTTGRQRGTDGPFAKIRNRVSNRDQPEAGIRPMAEQNGAHTTSRFWTAVVHY